MVFKMLFLQSWWHGKQKSFLVVPLIDILHVTVVKDDSENFFSIFSEQMNCMGMQFFNLVFQYFSLMNFYLYNYYQLFIEMVTPRPKNRYLHMKPYIYYLICMYYNTSKK